MDSIKRAQDLGWESHPFLPVQIKVFLDRRKDQADANCFLVRLSAGGEIPEHIHETQEDLIFVLAGKGKMWIDGVGEFGIEQGSFIRVPRNTKHRMYEVSEDLLNYDVFVPPIF